MYTISYAFCCTVSSPQTIQLDDAALQVYKDGDFGSYLDLESSLAEQSDEMDGLHANSRKNSLVVRTQLSVRVHAIIGMCAPPFPPPPQHTHSRAVVIIIIIIVIVVICARLCVEQRLVVGQRTRRACVPRANMQ